jgi:hypothetical protein
MAKKPLVSHLKSANYRTGFKSFFVIGYKTRQPGDKQSIEHQRQVRLFGLLGALFLVLKMGKILSSCPINLKVFNSKGRKNQYRTFSLCAETAVFSVKNAFKLNKGLSDENGSGN